MKYKNHARFSGIFFLTAFVGGITGLAFLGPVVESPIDLTAIDAKNNEVLIGIIGILLLAISTVLIAVPMYPILRKKNEAVALASVVFRTIESSIYLLFITCWYGILRLSHLFVDAGSPSDNTYQLIGQVLYEIQTFHYNLVFFVIGAFMYYFLFYQTNLIPRWLAAWGMIGVSVNLINFLLVLFGVYDERSVVAMISEAPLALNELTLAVWLIVKGYNPEALKTLGIENTDTQTTT